MMMTMTNQTHTHTLGCVAKKEEVVALVIVVVDSGRWNVPAQQKKLQKLCVQCCYAAYAAFAYAGQTIDNVVFAFLRAQSVPSSSL